MIMNCLRIFKFIEGSIDVKSIKNQKITRRSSDNRVFKQTSFLLFEKNVIHIISFLCKIQSLNNIQQSEESKLSGPSDTIVTNVKNAVTRR